MPVSVSVVEEESLHPRWSCLSLAISGLRLFLSVDRDLVRENTLTGQIEMDVPHSRVSGANLIGSMDPAFFS
jgi:hypothetical protein